MTKPRTPKPTASRIPTTETEYERLLADAEQDLLVPWADLTRGRPRVGESKASEQTAIRLPTELMTALRARAEREHKALNAVIRDACTAWALHPPHQP